MANRLKMATAQSILTLKRLGWSNRRIERKLHIRRETVSRHIQLAQQDSKPATNAPSGSQGPQPVSNAPLGSAREDAGESGLGVYRWVVERTLSWLHQFRRLRIRYERRLDIHQAFLMIACIVICYRYLENAFC